jgi:predicted TIM-barrel fold metal-dependent hydrolase
MWERRTLLQAIAGVGALAALTPGEGRARADEVTTAKPACGDHCGHGRTDIHAHYLPAPYKAAIKQAGLTSFDGGIPIPEWSVEAHLAMMEKQGIATSILSISSPGLDFLDEAVLPPLARDINEAGSQICRDHPGKFGLFATLPLPDIAASLAEIDYAYDILAVDGVAVESNCKGRYLADPALTPVLESLDRRNAVLYVHPTSPQCFEQVGLGLPAPLIEFPFDTTRTVVDLIFNGTLKRFPNIRVVLSHGGGALPILLSRIAMVAEAPFVHPRPKNGGAEVIEEVQRLYFDLALSASPLNIQALLEITSASHLLFGSDYPFAPPPAIAGNTARYEAELAKMSPEHRRMIEYDNAADLFPRLKKFLGTSD